MMQSGKQKRPRSSAMRCSQPRVWSSPTSSQPPRPRGLRTVAPSGWTGSASKKQQGKWRKPSSRCQRGQHPRSIYIWARPMSQILTARIEVGTTAKGLDRGPLIPPGLITAGKRPTGTGGNGVARGGPTVAIGAQEAWCQRALRSYSGSLWHLMTLTGGLRLWGCGGCRAPERPMGTQASKHASAD